MSDEQIQVRMNDSYAITPMWLLQHPTASDGAIRVWMALWSFSSGVSLDGRMVWPARKTAAERAMMSVRSFDRYVNELIKIGAISRTHRFRDRVQTSSVYSLNFACPVRNGAQNQAQTPSVKSCTGVASETAHKE